LGVKISSRAEVASEEKPTFETAEKAPAPVAKKKVKLTKPDMFIHPDFEGTEPSGKWQPMSKAPSDEVILVAVQSPTQPEKWDYREVRWFVGPHGPGWYVVGAQWHSLNEDSCRGWIKRVGHP
jgi:hypothetical protein